MPPRWFIRNTSTDPLTGRRPPSGGYQISFGHVTEMLGHAPEFGGHDAETVGHAPPKYAVNHNEHFQNAEGVNTNFAENVFSRIRPAVAGAWHRMTVQNLIEYAWEVAWRQEMVGHDNLYQLEDLLRRLLTSGRPTRFIDYWHKRPKDQWPPQEEVGELVEIPKGDMPKKRGRPPKGSIRPPKPSRNSDPKPTANDASTALMPPAVQPVDLTGSSTAENAFSTVDSVGDAENRTQDGDQVRARGSPPGA